MFLGDRCFPHQERSDRPVIFKIVSVELRLPVFEVYEKPVE